MSDELYNYPCFYIHNYPNGNLRLGLENMDKKKVICDIYVDKDNIHDNELKKLIHKTVKDYFKGLAEEKTID